MYRNNIHDYIDHVHTILKLCLKKFVQIFIKKISTVFGVPYNI